MLLVYWEFLDCGCDVLENLVDRLMEDLLRGVFLDDAVVNTFYIAIHIASPCKSVRSRLTINICFFRFGNIEYILYVEVH